MAKAEKMPVHPGRRLLTSGAPSLLSLSQPELTFMVSVRVALSWLASHRAHSLSAVLVFTRARVFVATAERESLPVASRVTRPVQDDSAIGATAAAATAAPESSSIFLAAR